MQAPTHPSPTFAITSALLTKQELAKRLGLSARTVENLVRAGGLPEGVRVGRFLYWTDAVVDAWQRRLFASQNSWAPDAD
ncbi:helix-turn-helix transcriptional regulator [Variovorax sp. RHLX14]|uniref:helix-turn-helix transcriptional regulator n=1 Tax=Variovorax sp. RHLX14 TaxID=1259731 RepID=UPI003F45940C